MDRKEIAKAIRTELKENGITNKQISVTSRAALYDDSIRVNIKDINVSYKIVNEIASKYKSISYDQYNGEILAGGNTYVSVNFDYDSILTERKKYFPKAQQIMKQGENYNENESMTIISKGNLTILYQSKWCNGNPPSIGLYEKPEGWEKENCYCLTNIKRYDARCKESIAEALLMFACQYKVNVLEEEQQKQDKIHKEDIEKNEDLKISDFEKELQQQKNITESKRKEKQENNNINVSIKFNKDKNGIELHFDGKPSQEIREKIKSQGFRWSRYQKIWFCKDTQERRGFLKEIGFLKNDNKEPVTVSEIEKNIKKVEYPEIDINDIGSYTISKDLNDRENSISMFRNYNTDHTKELQKMLKQANNNVLELINIKGCTPYIEYKAKTIVQSFKKNYTDAYISILEYRANNPSWAVTGRGGLNIHRYNKKQEQLHNKKLKTNELINKFNYKINKLKNQIKKNKKQQFKNNLNSITDIPKFTRKKIKINGEANANIFNLDNASYTKNVTAHQYNNYSIIKNWGTFRIYDLEGIEVGSVKTNENLNIAKKYVMYLIKNQKTKSYIA